MNNTLSGSVLLFISISLSLSLVAWHFHLRENRIFPLPHAHKSFVIYRQGSSSSSSRERKKQ
jgi:hypothetical protein